MVAAGLAVSLVGAVGLCGWITWSGLQGSPQKADCIIVPGARVDEHGVLGPSMQARTEHAVSLWHQGYARAVIFTGGRGEAGTVESECARAYAVSRGVPGACCFTENRSHDTEGNFHYASAIMKAQGWQSCLVSTDPFHVRRCLQIARDEGLTAWPAPAFESPAWRRPDLFCWYTLRECAAWVKYVMRRTGIYPDPLATT